MAFLKLTSRQWASVLVVWLFLLYALFNVGISGTGFAASAVVLLPVVYLVQLGMVVGGARIRSRSGRSA